jgi:MFS family permease
MAHVELPARRAGQRLWRHPDFLKLWGGETIALFGIQVAALAVPLTAAVSLGASPFQMGVLSALSTAPSLLFGLFAGAWADRLRRRPILIVANVLRAALLASIPVLAFFGLLRMEQLYALAIVVGSASVFFVAAYQPYLATLVAPEDRIEGNSKLRLSDALAQIAGPGLGGVLVQLIGAPLTLIISAIAPLCSASAIASIRTPETEPVDARARRPIWGEIGEGAQAVFAVPLLRLLVTADAVSSFGGGMIASTAILYITRQLGIGPGLFGAIVAISGPAAILGTVLAGRLARACGLGPLLIGALFLTGGAALLLPLAATATTLNVALLVGWRALDAIGSAIYGINFYTVLQTLPPPRVQGRVNATARVCIWGATALGGLMGGAIGQGFGLRGALTIAATIMLLAPLGLLLSRMRRVRAITT